MEGDDAVKTLAIQRLTIDEGGEPLDYADAKECHTLRRCVRQTVHPEAFEVLNEKGDRRLKPEAEWPASKVRNEHGLPVDIEFYPVCPCFTKRELGADGKLRKVGLRDFGCSVAVDLFLRLQLEATVLFVLVLLISIPSWVENENKNGVRRDCRIALRDGTDPLAAPADCGYAGLDVRTAAAFIDFPDAGYPWLTSSLGACEEYSNATTDLQVSFGTGAAVFLELDTSAFCHNDSWPFWVQFGVVCLFVLFLVRMHRLSRVAALHDDASRVTTADFAVLVRGLYGYNDASPQVEVGELKQRLVADLGTLGFDVANDVDHIELGRTCRELLHTQDELCSVKESEAEARGRYNFLPNRRCGQPCLKRLFDCAILCRTALEKRGYLTPLHARSAALSAKLAQLRTRPAMSTGHAFITFQLEKDRDRFRDLFHRKGVRELPLLQRARHALGGGTPPGFFLSRAEQAFAAGKYPDAPKPPAGPLRSCPHIAEVEVLSAPEPSEVLWANLELSDSLERWWTIVGKVLILVLILVAMGITIALRVANASFSNQPDATPPTALRLGATTAVALVIALCNAVLLVVSRQLTKREGPDTKTDQARSLFLKLSKAYLANSVVVPALVGVITSLDVQRVAVNQAWYEESGVVATAASLIIINAAAYNGLRLAQALPLFKRLLLSRFATTQDRLRSLHKPPPMLLGNLYAESAATIGLGCIYGPIYPPAYLLTALALLACWVSTKFSIKFWYARPPTVNTEMLDALRYRISLVLAVSVVFEGLTAWYAASRGSRFDRLQITAGATVASPLIWFLYEIAPLQQLRCLKSVQQLFSAAEIEHETSGSPRPSERKAGRGAEAFSGRSCALSEPSRGRVGGAGRSSEGEKPGASASARVDRDSSDSPSERSAAKRAMLAVSKGGVEAGGIALDAMDKAGRLAVTGAKEVMEGATELGGNVLSTVLGELFLEGSDFVVEDLSNQRFENVLEAYGYEVEVYRCPVDSVSCDDSADGTVTSGASVPHTDVVATAPPSVSRAPTGAEPPVAAAEV